jgi:hypothetical protein
VTSLLDTDHITILQRETGPAYATLRARLAQHPPEELAFSIISLHEQVMGCHTSINQARTAADLVRGSAMADPQAFLAVLERIKQAAGPVVEGDEL